MVRGGARASAEMLAAMSTAVEHRGPDDVGFLALGAGDATVGRAPEVPDDTRVALVHRRLSIFDLSAAGWQPMTSGDGRYHLAFNGEIYNYVELREQLRLRGVSFRSGADTEVLLELLAREGEHVLPRLNGMFAFAFLDTRESRLLLARDAFGMKPLYVAHDDRALAFASEVRALLTLPWVRREVNVPLAYEYLRHGLTDHGDETLLEGVRQMPAAHFQWFALDGPWRMEPVRYWTPDTTNRLDLGMRGAADRLRETFLESVRVHLRSDVPVGAALSGGLDSSAIVCAARQVLGPSAELHAFTYAAGDGAVNEEAYVAVAAERAGATVHTVRLSKEDIGRDFERLMAVQDFPVRGTSIYAQHRVFRLARERGIKVMLDGQGADELFGGYRQGLSARLASLVRTGRIGRAAHLLRHAAGVPGENGAAPSSAAQRRLALGAGAYLLPSGARAAARAAVGKSAAPSWLDRRWLASREVRPREMLYTAVGRNLLRSSLLDQLERTSLPSLLRFEDRNSMACSIESRLPFLTIPMAELAFALPEDLLVTDRAVTKAVLREAMRGIVPDAIIDRKDKIGFATPEGVWLSALAPRMDEMFASQALDEAAILDAAVVRASWASLRARGGVPTQQMWRWYSFLAWVRAVGARLD